ncbi:DUF4157 domain-containing protein [Nakamurella antarctica]|uniref:eCIS core domain-containing protein n=1 Tax=Nakamurella antarctica TaxID=1902245 RepID=UPI0013DE5E58|nr:DUF4157 domain-containing protein [Nakamurella antarctica]
MGNERPSGQQLFAAAEPPARETALPVAVPHAPLGAVLTVGHALDPAEADADARADRALARLDGGGSAPGADAHRHGAGCDHIQRSALPGGSSAHVGFAGGALDSDLSSRIISRKGGGRALDGPLRQRLESGFNQSLSGVRVHTDSAAAALSRSVSARAFTTGKDIFFGAGEYSPETPAGERVLAHEIAHTMQNSDGIGRLFGSKKTPAEIEAAETKKKEKAELKAAEKEQTKAAKATNKKAKANEREEDERLKGERKLGKESREATKDAITLEQTAGDKSSPKAVALYAEFDRLLAMEKEVVTDFIKLGIDPAQEAKMLTADESVKQTHEAEMAKYTEECIDKAYEYVWLKQANSEMRALRPPRETAAERLTAAVRKARNLDRVDDAVRADTKHGQLLSKRVERVYDEYVTELARLTAANIDDPNPQPEDVLEQHAEILTWGKVTDKATLKNRPTDGAIVEAALRDARKRTNISLAPVKKTGSGLETATDIVDQGRSIAGGVLNGASLPIQGALKKVGTPKDKKLQLKAGFTATEPAPLEEKIPIIGGLAKAINSSKKRVDDGQAHDKVVVKPVSVETQASLGFGSATSIFTGLISSVSGIMKMAKAIQTAHGERTPRNIMRAAKACAEGASSVAGVGRSSAELAKAISPGITASVGSVIPGFNIFITVMSIVRNALSLADMSMRVNDTSNQLFEARSRTNGTGVDVMIYPLQHVASVYAKKLEQTVWDTAISISEFATSVATVASGGGYGIPVAVQAGVKLIDLLHTAGHFIADQVIAVQAQSSRKDAMLSLEGAAENQLRKDPSMAVDGIIVQAKDKKDPIAIKFLLGHGVEEADIAAGKIGKIREIVLGEIGESGDPLTAYQSFKKTAGGVLTSAKGVGDKWSKTGALASDRNSLEGGTSRGFRWRLKMMFKGADKFDRSLNKTSVVKTAKEAADGKGQSQQPTAEENHVLLTVGKLRLFRSATADQFQNFMEMVEKLDDTVITDAIALPENDEARGALEALLVDRAQALAKV